MKTFSIFLFGGLSYNAVKCYLTHAQKIFPPTWYEEGAEIYLLIYTTCETSSCSHVIIILKGRLVCETMKYIVTFQKIKKFHDPIISPRLAPRAIFVLTQCNIPRANLSLPDHFAEREKNEWID